MRELLTCSLITSHIFAGSWKATSRRSQSPLPDRINPDAFSPTLRKYHKILWSKPLPNGKSFDLHDANRSPYLYHRSALGEFCLSSDGAITTFCNERRLAAMLAQIPVEEREAFERLCNT